MNPLEEREKLRSARSRSGISNPLPSRNVDTDWRGFPRCPICYTERKGDTIMAIVVNITTALDNTIRRGEIRPLEGELRTPAQRTPIPEPVTSSPVTFQFDTGTEDDVKISKGGSPADAGIAVSSTHICLTARGAFCCYTKFGMPVSL